MNELDGAAAPISTTTDKQRPCGTASPPQTLATARAAHRRLVDLASQAEQARGQVLGIFSAIEAHRQSGVPTTFDVAVELDDTSDRLLDLMGRIHDACDPYTAWADAELDAEPAVPAADAGGMVVIEVGNETLDDHFAFVPTADEVMIGMDRSQRIVVWNEAAERLFGWSQHEATGRQISIIVPDGGMDEVRQRCERVFDGQPEQFVALRRHRDGTPISVTVTPSAIFTSSGEVVGALATYRPVRRDSDHA